jgi:hypothetical protein
MKKELRNRLNEVSEKTYGSKTFYQKLRTHKDFQIPVRMVKDTSLVYVKVGNTGTLMKEETAVSKYGFVPKEHKEPRNRIQYRRPTDDELLLIIETAFRNMVVARILKDQYQDTGKVSSILAHLHSLNQLNWRVSLKRTMDSESYNQAVTEGLSKMPESHKNQILEWTIGEDHSDYKSAMDLECYINDYLFAVNNPEESRTAFMEEFSKYERQQKTA